MSEQESALVAQVAAAHKLNRNDLPHLGEWYWVKCKLDDEKKEVEHLMCAEHIGSNYTRFGFWEGEYGHNVCIMHWEVLGRVRPAPDWKEILQAQSDELQLELKEAVKKLADLCVKTNLIDNPSAPKVETMLPVLARQCDPKDYKQSLVKLKEKQFPAQEKKVKGIMAELVGVQKNMFLAQHAELDQLTEVVKRVDDRLFALELYAGFHEEVKELRGGEPAPAETPITVLQMLRYMDEETLIDAVDGGMDFTRLEDFDDWAVNNIDTVAPYGRCIVAFQIRRLLKDYGPCEDIGRAFTHCEWHEKNMKTYLLIRNGERVYRFATAIDFRPRLIPLREEFNQPLFKDHYWSSEEKEPITPEDVEYDECLEKRTKVMMQYNRITFLLQGLLDRSKVFEPHEPIALNDPAQVERWVVLKRDEEDGLAANLVSWDKYRDECNQGLKKDVIVYARWRQEERVSYARDYRMVTHRGFFRVVRRSRKKDEITISQPWGTRWGYKERDRYGGYYGEWGEWPVKKRRHFTVKLDKVFDVGAYKPGDYKQFLCDPYAKGEYLEWAEFLLKAEKFHKMTPEEKEKL